MIINLNDSYKRQLMDLWNVVFDDSYDYINLLFDHYPNNEYKIFAIEKDNKIVSALYAFKTSIKLSGQKFDGYYIYACATLPEYRKKGYLSQLLNEVINDAWVNNLSYLNLVPANAHLYDYYSKFKFKKGLVRYNIEIEKKESFISTNEITIFDYLLFRNKILDNAFIWNEESFDYLLCVFNYLSIKAYRVNDSIFLYDTDNKIVLEKISLINHNHPLEFSDYGMVYINNEELNDLILHKKIYMNLALE